MPENTAPSLAVACSAGGFKGLFVHGVRSWADQRLRAHLFDTAASDEAHHLTNDNIEEVIYIENRKAI